MENDVLRNQIAPWQDKGRWYKAVIHFSAANDPVIDEIASDEFLVSRYTVGGDYAIRFTNLPSYIVDSKVRLFNVQSSLNKPVTYPSITSNNVNGRLINTITFSVNSDMDFDAELWLFI